MTPSIRVVVAEDLDMIRGALVALLSLEPDIDVVGEAAHGDDVLDTVLRTHPDVVVLDILLPGLDGLSLAEILRRDIPSCAVLILTALPQPGHVVRALRAEVRGFMVKDAPAPALAGAVRSVMAGELVIRREMLSHALKSGSCPLTAREMEVLQASERGAPTAVIARELCLSPTTVRNYLSNAIGKLGARNRLEALHLAREAGWLLSDPAPATTESEQLCATCSA